MNDDVQRLLHRLAELSPMPADDDPNLTVERLEAYDSVLNEIGQLFQRELDPRFIQPLLHSFGYGDGYEVYWNTLHLLEKFPSDILRPYLQHALRTGARGTRKWASYMLGRERNAESVPTLIAALDDSEWEVRYGALQALVMIGDESAQAAMERLADDPVEEVRKAAKKYVAALLDKRYVIRNK